MRNHLSPPNRERGQAIVLIMAILMLAAGTVVVLYNTAQTATEKTRLVNAVDAAAYSGAIWTARNLNFMAYTNRAMVANHVAVGHFVSYMSWIRYMEDSTDKLDTVGTILSVIPYVGPAIKKVTQMLEKYAGILERGTEQFGKVYVPMSDGLNSGLSIAQLAAKASMGASTDLGFLSTPLHGVMEHAAKQYTESESIKVNHPQELLSLDGALSGAQITSELAEIFNFTKRYSPADDSGKMKSLVDASLGPSREWIDDRDWSLSLLGIIKLKKQSSNSHSMGRLSDWQESDRLRYKWPGGKWKTLASGSASASEFDRNYEGIPRYYDLEDRSPNEQRRLTVTAYATMPISEARIMDLMGMRTTTTQMAAVSRAEIVHVRPPTPAFATVGEGEYSNVFNPFWEGRLTRNVLGL